MKNFFEIVLSFFIFVSESKAQPRHNYNYERPLHLYASFFINSENMALPEEAEFLNVLNSLTESQRWLEVGAGEGNAIYDYIIDKLVKGDQLPAVVAVSLENDLRKEIEEIKNNFTLNFTNRIGRIETYSVKDLGQFDVISDIFSAVVYSRHLDEVMTTLGGLLKVNGLLYSLMGKEKGTFFGLPYFKEGLSTRIWDERGHKISVFKWLDSIKCLKRISNAKPGWRLDCSIPFVMVKTCEDVRVPPLKLISFKDDFPPNRDYVWKQQM